MSFLLDRVNSHLVFTRGMVLTTFQLGLQVRSQSVQKGEYWLDDYLLQYQFQIHPQYRTQFSSTNLGLLHTITQHSIKFRLVLQNQDLRYSHTIIRYAISVNSDISNLEFSIQYYHVLNYSLCIYACTLIQLYSCHSVSIVYTYEPMHHNLLTQHTSTLKY